MYTMIDAIGAPPALAPRARLSTAFVPSCVSDQHASFRFANLPELKPFAVATTCVAQPARLHPARGAIPPPARVPGRRRRRRRRQGAHVRGGGVLGAAVRPDEVRRGDEKSRERSSRRGAFPTDPASPQPSLAGASHPSRPTSSARPSPRTVEPTPDRPAARPN